MTLTIKTAYFFIFSSGFRNILSQPYAELHRKALNDEFFERSEVYVCRRLLDCDFVTLLIMNSTQSYIHQSLSKHILIHLIFTQYNRSHFSILIQHVESCYTALNDITIPQLSSIGLKSLIG